MQAGFATAARPERLGHLGRRKSGHMGRDCSGVTGAILAKTVAIPNGMVMISPWPLRRVCRPPEDNGCSPTPAPSDARQGVRYDRSSNGARHFNHSCCATYTKQDYGQGVWPNAFERRLLQAWLALFPIKQPRMGRWHKTATAEVGAWV